MTADPAADRAAIGDVLADYAYGIDARDFDLVASLFTDDAVLDYSSPGGPVGGRDEVVAWLREMLAAVTATQHLLSNVRVRLDGDTATSRAELLNPLVMATPERTQLHLLGGSYDDELVRISAGWRISRRVHVTSWSAGPFPAALMTPPE